MHIEGTNPYPWPYDGQVQGEHLALLITGAQPAWADASVHRHLADENISALSSSVRRVGGSIIAARHLAVFRGRPTHLPPTSADPKAELLPVVADLAPDLVVDCIGADALYSSRLEALLHATGRTHLLICGYASEVTVDSTLRSLNDRGFECLVVTDALAPLDLDLSAHILDSVTKSGGIFGALGTTAAACAALAALTPAHPAHTQPS